MNATSEPAVKDVDVRGFAYALEPLRQRQRWQLDAALASLADAQHELDITEKQLLQLRQAHDAQARALSDAAMRRLDADAHRRTLAYLAQSRERAVRLEIEHNRQRETRDERRRDCVARQLRLDGLEQHRRDTLAEFANEARRRQANEHDREWLARAAATHAHEETPG